MSGDASGDLSLIGQFGVGFYSVYLVADKVRVRSKHNDDGQHVWESAADSSFSVWEDATGESIGRGTEITLYLKEDAGEFLDQDRLEELVLRYSEFITFPIYLYKSKTETVELEDEEDEEDLDDEDEEDDEEGDEDLDEEDDEYRSPRGYARRGAAPPPPRRGSSAGRPATTRIVPARRGSSAGRPATRDAEIRSWTGGRVAAGTRTSGRDESRRRGRGNIPCDASRRHRGRGIVRATHRGDRRADGPRKRDRATGARPRRYEDEDEAPRTTTVTNWDWHQVNSESAIWARDTSDVGDDEYRSFYKTLSKDTADPTTWIHFKAEGEVEFKSILFVPGQVPFDMYDS